MRIAPKIAVLATLLSVQLAFAPLAVAQETRYIYDPLGRLIGVIDQDGRITIYDYDPAGNLLGIRRPETTTPVTITLVNPSIGVVGTQVEILGVGFSALPTANELAFNGVPAVVMAASPNRLVTQVPAGATSGPITLTTPLGSATSPAPFRVPGIMVQPSHTTIAVGRQRRFMAAVAETMDQRVVWSVNGFIGGNATVGTIGIDGTFRAPADVPTPAHVQIQARSVPFPFLFAVADVVITPPDVAIVASPHDLRLVRPGIGEPGGLALNLTVASPHHLTAVRPGIGDPGGLPLNLTVASPWHLGVVRPGTGEMGTLPLNLTVASPPHVTTVRPGTGDAGTLPFNVTVAAPPDVSAVRPGTGDVGLQPNVTIAAPVEIRVLRPGVGDAGGVPHNVTIAQPHHVEVRRP